MEFTQLKEQYLSELGQPDRSRAGKPDPQIVPMLDTINSKDSLYTTSSCAGRSIVAELSPTRKKHETAWLVVNHDPITLTEVLEAIKQRRHEQGYEIWFKMESPILHVCAKDMATAQILLALCKEVGMKRAGIMGATDRIMIEILDSFRIDAPICVDGELIVDEKYLDFVVKSANQKLAQSRDRLERLRLLIEQQAVMANSSYGHG